MNASNLSNFLQPLAASSTLELCRAKKEINVRKMGDPALLVESACGMECLCIHSKHAGFFKLTWNVGCQPGRPGPGFKFVPRFLSGFHGCHFSLNLAYYTFQCGCVDTLSLK